MATEIALDQSDILLDEPIITHIPFRDINRLPQPRRTFEDIQNMADSLTRSELMKPLSVAVLDQPHLNEYMGYVDRVWGDEYALKDPKPTEDGSYLILIDGERRLRAILHLDEVGCTKHQELYGNTSCYHRHFRHPNTVRASLYYNIDPKEALRLQEDGNLHQMVPPHQQAESYSRKFKVEKHDNPKLTLAQFAKSVGRAEDTMRAYLRYVDLPNYVQNLVEGRTLPYQKAIEIQRLNEALQLSEEDLKWWVVRACSEGKTVGEFTKLVSLTIAQRDQQAMDLFAPAKEASMRQARAKKIVGGEFEIALQHQLRFVRTLQPLVIDGLVGPIFDAPHTRNTLRQIVGQLGDNLDQLHDLLPNGTFHEAQRVTGDTQLALESLVDTSEAS